MMKIVDAFLCSKRSFPLEHRAPVVFIKSNSFGDVFSRKNYNMEQLFDEHLFLQNTFHWMLLTFSCCFHMGKEEHLKKRTFIMDQKNVYRGAIEKRISQKMI